LADSGNIGSFVLAAIPDFTDHRAAFRLGEFVLLVGPRFYNILCALKGLKLDVDKTGEKVEILLFNLWENGNDWKSKKILEMVADKKITVDEAYRLLSLIQPSAESGNEGPKERKPSPKYLRVVVDTDHHWENGCDKGPQHVNIRVPVALIRAGVKWLR